MPPAVDDNAAAAVVIEGLRVRFGQVNAVDGLSVSIPSGSITAILGPNGAGKTTTLEVCEGLRRPTSGTATVLGTNPWRADARHRARVGVMLQNAGIPSGLRALEAVRSAAALSANPAPLQAVAERLRLAELGARPYRRLSGGEKQRVGLAVAVIGRPDLLILDEPTSGMDPLSRQETWALLQELRDAGATIVVTTHLIDEAEQLADSVALIAAGRLVRHATPREFTADASYVVAFEAAAGLPIAELASSAATTRADEYAPGRYRVTASHEAGVLDAVTRWGSAHGQTLAGVTAGRTSLQDVVLDLVDWGATR